MTRTAGSSASPRAVDAAQPTTMDWPRGAAGFPRVVPENPKQVTTEKVADHDRPVGRAQLPDAHGSVSVLLLMDGESLLELASRGVQRSPRRMVMLRRRMRAPRSFSTGPLRVLPKNNSSGASAGGSELP